MREGEKPEIAKLPLFAAMNPEQREAVFAVSYLQAFPAQLELFRVGERADFLHVLVDGLGELFTSTGNRETTMAVVQPVSVFILAAVYTDMPYLMAARTLAPSRILLIPAKALREAMNADPLLLRAAMHELSAGYRGLVRSLSDMKLRQSVERLANNLLRHSRQLDNAERFVLPVEKRTLASLLGMTPESLSRSFGALATHGVRIDGAEVIIEDRAKLEAFAKPDTLIDFPDLIPVNI